MTPTEEAVLAVLAGMAERSRITGYRGRLTQHELADAVRCSVREVQEAIQSLRLAGWPICSSSDGVHPGVWLATDAASVLANAKRLQRRAVHQLVTSRALRRTGRRMAVQEAAAQRLTLWSA